MEKGEKMLFEIDTSYCSRCKKFVQIFNAENINFSTTEINCIECGKILFVIRSEVQYEDDQSDNIEELEKFIHKENIKSARNQKIKKRAIKLDAF